MSLHTFGLLQIYLYDCTEVSPYCLLFFGGDISIQKDNDQDTIAVDEWIVFQSPARIAQLVKVIIGIFWSIAMDNRLCFINKLWCAIGILAVCYLIIVLMFWKKTIVIANLHMY